MVMEYFAESTLKDHFDNKYITYDEEDITSIMTQCLCGLQYMHSANFVHRDLKPENILIKQNPGGRYKWKVVIADFGFAKCFGRAQHDAEEFHVEERQWEEFLKTCGKNQKHPLQPFVHTKHVATRYYRAPEVSLLQQAHEGLTKIDIWSLGCIFGELLQMRPENKGKRRRVLFPGKFELLPSWEEMDERATQMHKYPEEKQREIINDQLIMKIFDLLGSPDQAYIASIKRRNLRRWVAAQDKRKPVDLAKKFPHTNAKGRELFKHMLQYNPQQRFTAEQCLAHAYLAPTSQSGLYNTTPSTGMTEEFELQEQIDDVTLRALVCQEIHHYNPTLGTLQAASPEEEEVQPRNMNISSM